MAEPIPPPRQAAAAPSDITVSRAWMDGLRRVARAPALVAGLWAATVLLTLPLVLAPVNASRLVAVHPDAPVDRGVERWNEFLAQSGGLGQTVVPVALAVAAGSNGALLLLNVAVSLFLLGGTVYRLACDRGVGAAVFFSACRRFVLRLLRLAIAGVAVYWPLFVWAAPLIAARTRGASRLVLYLLFAAIVSAVNVWFDYAKVRLVVEDRRSAIGALAASLRFIRRHAPAALALFAINATIFLLVLSPYVFLAAGPASAGVAILAAQLYIALRIAARLLFTASQVALFQGRLAHRGYVATQMTRMDGMHADKSTTQMTG